MEIYLKGKEGKPPMPLGFKASPLLWGIQLDWAFPTGAEDTLKTEIQYADNAAGNNAMLLADIPYPLHTHAMTGLKAGQAFWFRARLQDRTGNQGTGLAGPPGRRTRTPAIISRTSATIS